MAQAPAPQPNKPAWGRKNIKLIVILVIAVVAIAGVVYYLRQPSIHVTDFRFIDTTCFYGRSMYWVFNLVNTGGNGFAHINYLLDGNVFAQSDYYVRSQETVNSSETAQTLHVSDCNPHTGIVQLTAQWAA